MAFRIAGFGSWIRLDGLLHGFMGFAKPCFVAGCWLFFVDIDGDDLDVAVGFHTDEIESFEEHVNFLVVIRA